MDAMGPLGALRALVAPGRPPLLGFRLGPALVYLTDFALGTRVWVIRAQVSRGGALRAVAHPALTAVQIWFRARTSWTRLHSKKLVGASAEEIDFKQLRAHLGIVHDCDRDKWTACLCRAFLHFYLAGMS